MRTEKTLTPKEIKIAIKRGETISELQERFGLISEQEVLDIIGKTFKNGTTAIIKQLKRNEKLQKREHASLEKNQAMELSEQDEIANISSGEEEFLTDNLMENVDTDATAVETETIFEQLQADEKEYSRLLLELEQKHKACVQNRRQIVERLQTVNAKCSELLKEVERMETELGKLKSSYDDVTLEMLDYTSDISATKKLLSDLRKQIAEAQKISIFVYKNGDVELEQVSSGEKVEKSLKELIGEFHQDEMEFTKLVGQPMAEEMTVTQLRIIINVQTMARSFEEQGISYKFIFEDEKPQRFYDSITE